LISSPPPLSLRLAWIATLFRPWASFHRKTDRTWAVGYACYHVAILLVVTGYAVSLGLIGLHLVRGRLLPDYFSPAASLTHASVGNLMFWVFGNAETRASDFLFGRLAPAFRAMAWLELPLALFGKARVGAIRRGLDSVSDQIRYKGCFSGQRLLVRIIILGIITLEFIGRFDGCKPAAAFHTVVAFTLIALVPVTYLTHIPLAPVALWQALSRRRMNRVA
jgi:hypothetical protein